MTFVTWLHGCCYGQPSKIGLKYVFSWFVRIEKPLFLNFKKKFFLAHPTPHPNRPDNHVNFDQYQKPNSVETTQHIWTLQSHLTLWMSDRALQCLFDWWRVMSQCIRILPGHDQFRNWPLLRSSVVTSVYMLANLIVNNMSVTLWFCLQCSCKKCLYPVIPLAPMPCKTLFLSTCVLQDVCVYTMDFVSGHK